MHFFCLFFKKIVKKESTEETKMVFIKDVPVLFHSDKPHKTFYFLVSLYVKKIAGTVNYKKRINNKQVCSIFL